VKTKSLKRLKLDEGPFDSGLGQCYLWGIKRFGMSVY